MISLQFSNGTKSPLVAYSLCKIHLGGIKNKTATQRAKVSPALHPNNISLLFKTRLRGHLVFCVGVTPSVPLNLVH